jgi:hypothetical protein
MGSWSFVPSSPGLDGLLELCAAEPRAGWAPGVLCRRAPAWMCSWIGAPSSPGVDGLLELCAVEPRPGWAAGWVCRRAPAEMGHEQAGAWCTPVWESLSWVRHEHAGRARSEWTCLRLRSGRGSDRRMNRRPPADV